MADRTSIIQADFDRIALLTADEWNHNSHYQEFLLGHVPARCHKALEIGCGTGTFSRRLAGRAERVLALDLSPQMIRMARERSQEFSNIDFHVADVLRWDFSDEEFDCIATIATLHHLPVDLMLSKMKRALKPNGVLLILDLFEAKSLTDMLMFAAALPVNAGLRLIKHRRLRAPAAMRAAWAEHEQHDSFLTLSQVREICAEVLPGARVKRHLLWRYSVVWKKTVI
jgi:ubiquinone/menaquinone biosynthesis C-methylase UbiE